MSRFVRRPAFSLIRDLLIAFLCYCLIGSPLLALRPVRAERAKPTPVAKRTQSPLKPHKPGGLIVKFKQDATAAQRATVVSAFVQDQKPLRGRSNLVKLQLKLGLDVASTANLLKQLDAVVEYAEPDYLVGKTSVAQQPAPNDPQFAQQWALANTGQGGGASGSDIGALAGWQTTTGAQSTIIAIIDTGIDLNHPDLAGNLWINQKEASGQQNNDDDRDGYTDDVAGWNFVADSPNVADDQGHGTAMAGIIAARGNNGVGMAGVLWRASLMPLKALDATGGGYISDVVEAIDFAAAHGASVINCSFGTEAFSQSLLDAINRASQAGALVVASAGNTGQNISQQPYYPAGYTAGNLITVAATTNTDALAPFSNYSATLVHMAAPGVNVLTTAPGGGYTLLTGTSAAAPLVAGAAGLLKTIRPWISAQTVKQSLIDGVRKAGNLSGSVSAAGVVSLGNAIEVFRKATDGSSKPVDPGNGGGGPGGGGPGGGGGGGATGQLDFMRANRPQKPEPRVTINNLPADPNYDPPSNSGGSDNYFAAADYPGNETGRAQNRIARVADRTVSNPETSIILGSQNMNFTVPIVSLNGRAGFGVNLALSYNSRIWFVDPWSNKLAFNSDNGVPAPGWRIGFGQLQGGSTSSNWIPPFINQHYGNKYTYIWVEPDGTRRTLVGTTQLSNDVYKSNDATNIEYNKLTGVLRFANGVEMTFDTPTNQSGQVIGNELMPKQIKDRNGNKISITNMRQSNNNWVIDKIDDTMGRTLKFAYQNNVLIGVYQARPANGGNQGANNTEYWFVKLDYTQVTLSTNFSVTTDPVNTNGLVIWEPNRIDLGNGDNYRFWYTSYGQMFLQEHWANQVAGQGPERRISYTWYDLPSLNAGFPSTAPYIPVMAANSTSPPAQSSCPKFSQRKEQAEFWNNDAVVTYSYSSFTPTGGGTATKVTDSLNRIFRTDTNASSTLQTSWQWSDATSYGSDSSPNLSNSLKTVATTYASQPEGLEVTQVLVSDAFSNNRKTTYDYTAVGGARLVANMREYVGNTSTVYRRTETSYNTDTAYSNRHIFGLPAQVNIYSGESTLIARTNYDYDQGGDRWQYSGNDGVIQWDSTAPSGSAPTGRANLTTVTQSSVVSGAVTGTRYVSRTAYDSQGNVRRTTDAEGRTMSYEVWDNFGTSKPGGIGETHGLVTSAGYTSGGSPVGYLSGAVYDWYSGLPAQSFYLNGSTKLSITSYSYDIHWRLTGASLPNGGGFTRAYWDNWRAVAEYTLIDTSKTRYSFTAFDGAGRTRYTGGDHPNASPGLYSIQRYVYDAGGRTWMTSNVTAINGSYAPTDGEQLQGTETSPNGDGYRYNVATLDALDRTTQLTHPDNQSLTWSYSGCGCAGGLQVTATDESGRKRKQVYDGYGRLAEAHELWKSGALYNKAVYQYNAFDQITEIKHYDDTAANFQTRTFAYDGYARLQTQTTPEAGQTSYTYLNNDLVNTVQNQRSASEGNTATFGYNSRNLLESITYNGTATTPGVTYTYDSFGARETMTTAGVGSVTYGYNSARQLETETIALTGLGTHSLGYQYNLAGALKRITYNVGAWSRNVNYDYNSAGAPSGIGTNVTGSDPNTTNNIAGGMVYNSSGGIRAMNYGANPHTMQVGYDWKRQQMTGVDVSGTVAGYGVVQVLSSSYSYQDIFNSNKNTGRLMRVDNWVDQTFTTTYTYDDFQRLTGASSSGFTRNYSYDAWGNLKTVSGSGGTAPNYTLSYTPIGGGNLAPATNRISGNSYDAAGNQTQAGLWAYAYDAANRLKSASENGAGGNDISYDGDGRKVKHTTGGSIPVYLFWSSVLNQPVFELTTNGFYRVHVYSAAGQQVGLQSFNGEFYWVHADRLGSSRRMTTQSGGVVWNAEYDPHGQVVNEWSYGGDSYRNSRKYTGYERSWATGLDDARARSYQSQRARFLQPDPLADESADLTQPQSLNAYSYVYNDPINYVDPGGEIPIIPMVIGGATSVATGWAIAALTGQDYDWRDAAIDFGAGALGVGILSKARTLWRVTSLRRVAQSRGLSGPVKKGCSEIWKKGIEQLEIKFSPAKSAGMNPTSYQPRFSYRLEAGKFWNPFTGQVGPGPKSALGHIPLSIPFTSTESAGIGALVGAASATVRNTVGTSDTGGGVGSSSPGARYPNDWLYNVWVNTRPAGGGSVAVSFSPWPTGGIPWVGDVGSCTVTPNGSNCQVPVKYPY